MEPTRAQLLEPAMLARLQRLSLVARRMPDAKRRGRRRHRRLGAGTDAIDTRPYAPGDDPRRIAWPAYARFEKLLTRVMADEAPLRLVLVVDTSESMAFGEPPKLVHAARIAAGFAAVALTGEDRVAVLGLSHEPTAHCRAISGQKGLARVLHTLDRLTPSGRTDLSRAAISASAVATGRCLVVVISDLLDPKGVRETGRAIRARGHEVAFVEVLDRVEVEPPDLSGFELECSETGEIVELPKSGALEVYRAAFAAHREELERSGTELDAPIVHVTTDEAFDDFVLRAIGRGLLRGGSA
jgi:uncharacterized protein (DUF58 family)